MKREGDYEFTALLARLSLSLISFKLSSVSSLVSLSIMYRMVKYIVAPSNVCRAVLYTLFGCGSIYSIDAISTDANVYFAIALHGVLNGRHLHATTYLIIKNAALAITLITVKYNADSNGVFVIVVNV